MTESEILRAIRMIERLVNEGWSIQYARKKACGFSHSKLYIEVSSHPAYLPVLNNYMKKLKQKTQYKLHGGVLVAVRSA